MAGLYDLAGSSGPRKRGVFFSFHYADIMRVNNVRNCGKFKTGNSASVIYGSAIKSIEGFYDRSLWESRKLSGTEALKRLIREGVQNTSAICVLIGSSTYSRPWVRYEIARSVIDGRGLISVHLNNIPHHYERRANPLGLNPLDYMGIIKRQEGIFSPPLYYLCELSAYGQWVLYQNHTTSVRLPNYMLDPPINQVISLSNGAFLYDFALQNGYSNISQWIDLAAVRAGY